MTETTTRFAKGGAYPVTVSAHDGKGGIDARTLNLTVSDPLTAWTQRPTGVTNNLYAALYAGGKFVVAGDNGVTFSSADGLTWTRGSGMPNTHFPRGIAHSAAESRCSTQGFAARRGVASRADGRANQKIATHESVVRDGELHEAAAVRDRKRAHVDDPAGRHATDAEQPIAVGRAELRGRASFEAALAGDGLGVLRTDARGRGERRSTGNADASDE